MKAMSLAPLLLFAAYPQTALVANQNEQPENQVEEVSKIVDPEDRVKCKRLQVTGSLLKSRKVCKTVGEWRRISRQGSRKARTIVDHANQGSTSGR